MTVLFSSMTDYGQPTSDFVVSVVHLFGTILKLINMSGTYECTHCKQYEIEGL